MLPISIDLSPLIEEFALTVEKTSILSNLILDRITEEYRQRWTSLINADLKRTRSDYRRAIYIERKENEVVFGLRDDPHNPLPMMIEEGHEAWDEKEFFERSKRKKVTIGGGWYLTIPFRHATPEAVAESGFSTTLPQSVYNVAKQSSSPLSVSQLPEEYRVRGVRREIVTLNKVYPAYTHKSPIYQGLMRVDISSGKENRGGYFTFRRVSDKSDPSSWIHPAFIAKKFMDRALELANVTQITDIAIDQFLVENI